MSTEHTSDDEYEEVVTFVSFPELVNVDFIADDKHFIFQDMASAAPTCTVDQMVFKGKHSVQLGTMLFFDKEEARAGESDVRCLGHSINGTPFRLQGYQFLQEKSATHVDPTDTSSRNSSKQVDMSQSDHTQKHGSDDVDMDLS
ncbi:hypothetical protein EON65_16635 [archaeon]|nr:MAG: hypothetical protein EON65_16635 [archaeon]